MKQALVIHPIFSYYAGGELLCLHVCEVLQGLGYHVTLACDTFDPSEVERIYGLRSVMEKCKHAPIPKFEPIFPHFLALQSLFYARRVLRFFANTDADVVFSTQSSMFAIPGKRMFHFLYSISDLFSYPPGASPPIRPHDGHTGSGMYNRTLTFLWNHSVGKSSPTWLFAVGSKVLDDLRKLGYRNSSLMFPPCRTSFSPTLPKKKQVVQLTRIIPDKRLELFFEIAQMLPEYTFYLVGRNPARFQEIYPKYSKNLLAKIPRNVVYVEALLRERPELLQESKVYLYTGIERGIVMSIVEAIAAGCIPLSPVGVGAEDIINAAKVGFLYSTPEEAAQKIREVLEREYSAEDIFNVSRKAQLFSPEQFEGRIRALVAGPEGVPR